MKFDTIVLQVNTHRLTKLDFYMVGIYYNTIFFLGEGEIETVGGHSQGLLRIFWLPLINSGTGKATDFKFDKYIYRIHLN